MESETTSILYSARWWRRGPHRGQRGHEALYTLRRAMVPKKDRRRAHSTIRSRNSGGGDAEDPHSRYLSAVAEGLEPAGPTLLVKGDTYIPKAISITDLGSSSMTRQPAAYWRRRILSLILATLMDWRGTTLR